MIINIGKDLYLKGRIGWRGLSKDEYLPKSDYRIINATALDDGYVNWNKCGYISKERYEESSEIMLQENDILISKDGTLGKIGYVKDMPSKCTVASGIFVLRNTAEDTVSFDYLYHLLKSYIFKDFIFRNKAMGSTINHLYQRDLEQFEIKLPSIEVQNKIANILNDLEYAIDSNNKTIDSLQQLIKTIYDYWFMQFDFPNEEGEPYRSTGGKMVWNEAVSMEIPKDWKVVPLLDLVSWNGGSQPPKSEHIYEYKEGYVRFIQNRDYSTDNHLTYIPISPVNKLCNEMDIMVDKYGDAGTTRFGIKGAYNVALSRIDVKKDNIQEYIREYLSSDSIKQYLGASCIASTRASLNENNLSFLNICLPPDAILNKFEKIGKCAIREILNSKADIANLEKLKDFLLPLLMNGQVSFKEA